MGQAYVLDTSLLLGGKEPPRDGIWYTTPEADAEVSPGGRDARRYDDWKSLGLRIQRPTSAAGKDVERAAKAAGNWHRLSEADISLLALTVDLGKAAVLVSDDYTVLDVASRLGLHATTVNQQGIRDTQDWSPRCTGCGRWYDEAPKKDECPTCGSPVVLKRRN